MCIWFEHFFVFVSSSAVMSMLSLLLFHLLISISTQQHTRIALLSLYLLCLCIFCQRPCHSNMITVDHRLPLHTHVSRTLAAARRHYIMDEKMGREENHKIKSSLKTSDQLYMVQQQQQQQQRWYSGVMREDSEKNHESKDIISKRNCLNSLCLTGSNEKKKTKFQTLPIGKPAAYGLYVWVYIDSTIRPGGSEKKLCVSVYTLWV